MVRFVNKQSTGVSSKTRHVIVQLAEIKIHSRINPVPDSLFAFPKCFLINLRLAPGAFKTLRLRRIKQLKALIFRFA